jgi:CDP-diacylglycerol--serine O-phosphatidyltransferase
MKHIPNFITLLNLLSGSLAVVFALQGYPALASVMVIAGFLFDFLDGFSARLLKVQSAIGKELDSLADVISFGLAPAAILFGIHLEMTGVAGFSTDKPIGATLLSLIPFLLPVFAGLRLAKFNVDERQSTKFIGVPTPANGIMVLALPLVMKYQPDSFLVNWLESGWFIPAYSIIVAWLMVSPIRLFSLKIKGFRWSDNRFTFLYLVIALILLITLGYTGLFLTIPIYILYASILDIMETRKQTLDH